MDEGWVTVEVSTRVEWHADGSIWFYQPNGDIQVLVCGYS